MVEPQENSGNSSIRSSDTSNAMRRSPFSIIPISGHTLIYLRVLGWIVAISGVIAGIVMLVLAPETQSPSKLIHLSVSWMLFISSLAAGVFLNVVAGIGSAVLDIWMSEQNG